MAVQIKHSVLPQTKAISHLLRKQQTRTFHRLVKGSGLNALVRVMGLEPIRRGHTPLKRACLPIPAHSHKRSLRTPYYYNKVLFTCQQKF